MKRIVALLALFCLCLPMAFADDKPQYPAPVDKELYAKDFRGQKAPDFVVGQWLSKEPDRSGKVVLIDFWATWCPPCRATIPELNDYANQFKDDLVVIGVSDEDPATINRFNDGPVKIAYNSAVDPQRRMKDAFEVRGIPHVVIISSDGVVRWQGFPLDDHEPLTAAIIKQIIAADPGVKERHAKEKS